MPPILGSMDWLWLVLGLIPVQVFYYLTKPWVDYAGRRRFRSIRRACQHFLAFTRRRFARRPQRPEYLVGQPTLRRQ